MAWITALGAKLSSSLNWNFLNKIKFSCAAHFVFEGLMLSDRATGATLQFLQGLARVFAECTVGIC